MRITESKLRRIIRSVIRENEERVLEIDGTPNSLGDALKDALGSLDDRETDALNRSISNMMNESIEYRMIFENFSDVVVDNPKKSILITMLVVANLIGLLQGAGNVHQLEKCHSNIVQLNKELSSGKCTQEYFDYKIEELNNELSSAANATSPTDNLGNDPIEGLINFVGQLSGYPAERLYTTYNLTPALEQYMKKQGIELP